jgi:hypothetical protein
MKRILLIASVFMLSGCASVQNWIPSFWDDNQSASIINVRQKIDRLDCTSADRLPQVMAIYDQVRWFELYSDSKGWQQADVLRLTEPMRASITDFVRRSQDSQGSAAYCEIKKKLLAKQAETAAKAVLGRF